jgi:hypothetical protein
MKRTHHYEARRHGFLSAQPATSHRDARYARLVPDFVAFARDPASRDQARRILIARYFPPAERLQLYDLVGLSVPSDEQILRDADYKSPHEA